MTPIGQKNTGRKRNILLEGIHEYSGQRASDVSGMQSAKSYGFGERRSFGSDSVGRIETEDSAELKISAKSERKEKIRQTSENRCSTYSCNCLCNRFILQSTFDK